jgi:hypothetical protein
VTLLPGIPVVVELGQGVAVAEDLAGEDGP